MTPRNPAARRAAIIDAAADLIAEVGPAKLTHRLVAERAGVPLGSTTAYFSSIGELRQAGLSKHLVEIDRVLADIGREFEDNPKSAPDCLVDGLYAYLSDRRQVVSDVALSATASFDSEARELAMRWTDGLIAVLGGRIGTANAHSIAMIFDGATVHAAVRGAPIGRDELWHAVGPFIPAARGGDSAGSQ